MIVRKYNNLESYTGSAPEKTLELEGNGHCIIPNVFSKTEIKILKNEINEVFMTLPPDERAGLTDEASASMYRYQMFNRSALCQKAIENRKVLDVIEPLLGEDCHVISCTAWKNPIRQKCASNGQEWHTDAGPHIPRLAGIDWPEEIPYPIFVIGTHIYLQNCSVADGPTEIIPGSHKSGRLPPEGTLFDPNLTYKGKKAEQHIVKAGDVGLFVSDSWHRRAPTTFLSKGRFFLQTNYGRRDIAQRVLPTSEVNHIAEEAKLRAISIRQKQLLGLHAGYFYDG